MAEKILQPIEEDEAAKLLVYGDPGIGKTEFLASADLDPRTSPYLHIDMEGGTKTFRSRRRFIKTLAELGDPQPGLIDVFKITGWKQLQDIYDFLFKSKYEQQRWVYKSTGIDTVTAVNDLGLANIMLNDKPPGGRLEVDVAEQRDYLKLNAMMKEMLKGFRDIEGLHVFLSAHAQDKHEIANDPKSPRWIQPNLIGKLAKEIVGIVDYTGFMRAKISGAREMLFQPEGRMLAKERSERHIRSIKLLVDPTVTTFLNAVEGVGKK